MKRIHKVILEYSGASMLWALGLIILMVSFFVFGAASYTHLYRPQSTNPYLTPIVEEYRSYESSLTPETVVVMPSHKNMLELVDYLNLNIEKIKWYQLLISIISLILIDVGGRNLYSHLPTLKKEKRKLLKTIKLKDVGFKLDE